MNNDITLYDLLEAVEDGAITATDAMTYVEAKADYSASNKAMVNKAQMDISDPNAQKKIAAQLTGDKLAKMNPSSVARKIETIKNASERKKSVTK